MTHRQLEHPGSSRERLARQAGHKVCRYCRGVLRPCLWKYGWHPACRQRDLPAPEASDGYRN